LYYRQHFFSSYALIKINGGDIIPQDQHEEYVGQLNKLTKAWLEWGRKNNYMSITPA
jgi:hypothetical protein